VRLLEQGAEACGFRGAVWTRRHVAQLIRDHFGMSYHPTHVGRLLRHLGWSPQRPLLRATQRDAAAIAAWYAERWPALKKRRGTKGARLSG
jgi:transposase